MMRFVCISYNVFNVSQQLSIAVEPTTQSDIQKNDIDYTSTCEGQLPMEAVQFPLVASSLTGSAFLQD